MNKKIAIIADHDGKNIKPVTWELFAFAQKIQEHEKADIYFYLIGENTRTIAQKISVLSGCKTFAVDVLGTANYHGEIIKKTLSSLFSENSSDNTHGTPPGKTPSYILAPHTTCGIDYAPALSIALDGSCITSVEDLYTKGNDLYFVRAMFSGKIQASILKQNISANSPLVITVQTGAFKPVPPDENASADVRHIIFNCPQNDMIYKGCQPSPSKGSNLAKAEVIISGGRGIEEEENYKYIEMLADIFPRSAAGASRPICDYGWVEYSQQVGATGTIVSPKLYIACGISGATQHLEGIKDARFIIAINKDPEAPIFRVADICIVEDLIEFIPILIETSKKRKRPAN